MTTNKQNGANLVDCIVAMPGQLFYTTQIPVSLWFVTRNKKADPKRGFRDRTRETLFVDARRMGHLVDRVHRELTREEIQQIANVYHAWKRGEGYEDRPGWWKSAALEDIRQHGHVLTPGRYVGVEEQEDDLPAPRPGIFFVYAIKCQGGSYYIGHTDNLQRRWREHLSGKGADWTKRHTPVYIAHYEEFSSREEAVAREKELKTTAGRRWLKKAVSEGRARQAGGIPFEEKMADLTATLYEQFEEAHRLEAEIRENLEVLGYGK